MQDDSGANLHCVAEPIDTVRPPAPSVERMPAPTLRILLPMRDGIRLDTWVWLPAGTSLPAPAILIRTPYKEHVLGWKRRGAIRYLEDGYALVYQLVRGLGASEGSFSINNPADGADGFDSIEWIAAQKWCTGDVGMDGSSYSGMTQLSAASTRSPHLKCIIPAVVSIDFFNDMPRLGGVLSRHHALGWANLLAVDDAADLIPALWTVGDLSKEPATMALLRSRPAASAADDILEGDLLTHYRDILHHARMDSWWALRTLSAEQFASIDIPALLVTGNYDGSMGTLRAWRMLERYAPAGAPRWLLIGPWDHSQAYVGGTRRGGALEFGDAADLDLYAIRLAFFDLYLRRRGAGPSLPSRVNAFVCGRNSWIAAERYPFTEVEYRPLWLSANLTLPDRRGVLSDTPPAAHSKMTLLSDPARPMEVGERYDDPLDLSAIAAYPGVAVYDLAPLKEAVTLLGEFTVDLTIACDAPDADLFCWLGLRGADVAVTQLSFGALRLRYRNGFDEERLLEPNQSTTISVDMGYVAHALPAGAQLCLIIGTSFFPLFDPNPNSGEPIASGRAERLARITIFHGADCHTRVNLPVLVSTADEALFPGDSSATFRSKGEY